MKLHFWYLVSRPQLCGKGKNPNWSSRWNSISGNIYTHSFFLQIQRKVISRILAILDYLYVHLRINAHQFYILWEKNDRLCQEIQNTINCKRWENGRFWEEKDFYCCFTGLQLTNGKLACLLKSESKLTFCFIMCTKNNNLEMQKTISNFSSGTLQRKVRSEPSKALY